MIKELVGETHWNDLPYILDEYMKGMRIQSFYVVDSNFDNYYQKDFYKSLIYLMTHYFLTIKHNPMHVAKLSSDLHDMQSFIKVSDNGKIVSREEILSIIDENLDEVKAIIIHNILNLSNYLKIEDLTQQERLEYEKLDAIENVGTLWKVLIDESW